MDTGENPADGQKKKRIQSYLAEQCAFAFLPNGLLFGFWSHFGVAIFFKADYKWSLSSAGVWIPDSFNGPQREILIYTEDLISNSWNYDLKSYNPLAGIFVLFSSHFLGTKDWNKVLTQLCSQCTTAQTPWQISSPPQILILHAGFQLAYVHSCCTYQQLK